MRDPAVRVVFVCASGLTGPSEKQILGYAERLLALGHAVAVTVPAAAVDERSPRPEGLMIVGHRVSARGVDDESRRALREFEPTVVHAFSPRLRPVLVARSLAGDIGCPVAVHFEDDEWGLARGFASDSPVRRAARVLARLGAPLRPDLWPYATASSLRFAKDEAAAVDAIAPELAREVQARLGRPCATLLPTLPAAMTAAPGHSPELPVGDARIVAYTGSVYGPHLEDFELLLEAVAELQRRDHEVALVHSGHVARRFDGRAMALRAGMAPGSAHFVGYLAEPALLGLLRRADVLVQPGGPSEFNRLRLPSKLQAYLASGTPTITFACGFGELLEDRRDVLKTYGPGAGELADRLDEVLSDDTLASRLAGGGPAAAARLFDQARNTDALLAYYAAIRSATSG